MKLLKKVRFSIYIMLAFISSRNYVIAFDFLIQIEQEFVAIKEKEIELQLIEEEEDYLRIDMGG